MDAQINKLYAGDDYQSFSLIFELDSNEIEYELHDKKEADDLGLGKLPVLIVGNKVLNYKKAMRFAKKG